MCLFENALLICVRQRMKRERDLCMLEADSV